MTKLNGSKFFQGILSAFVATLVFTAAVPNFNAYAISGQVTVRSEDMQGNVISGFFTALYESDGTMLQSGFTETTFSFTDAGQYVGVSDFGDYVFDHWKEDGATNRYHVVSESQNTLTAVYKNIAVPVVEEPLRVNPGEGATKDEYKSYVSKAKELFITEHMSITPSGAAEVKLVQNEIPNINLSGTQIGSDPTLKYAQYNSLFDLVSQDPQGARFAIAAASDAGVNWESLTEMQQAYVILTLRSA